MSITSSKQTASDVSSDALLSGYLYKQTRDGRWQKRWFETSGVYLTYYKSKKMEKLLAALSLPQVGSIHVVPIDDKEQNPDKLDGLFALELSARIYILRAANDELASIWIQTLLKLKEQGIGISSLNPLGMYVHVLTHILFPLSVCMSIRRMILSYTISPQNSHSSLIRNTSF